MIERADISNATTQPMRKIHDGEEVFIKPIIEIERTVCCDCGLTHDVRYRVADDGRIGVTVWRNNRSTAQTRRYTKYAHRNT